MAVLNGGCNDKCLLKLHFSKQPLSCVDMVIYIMMSKKHPPIDVGHYLQAGNVPQKCVSSKIRILEVETKKQTE